MADQPKSKMDVGMQEVLKKQKEKEAEDEKLKNSLGTGMASQAAAAIIKRKKDLAETMKE
jgi:myosin-crossreactive antigen